MLWMLEPARGIAAIALTLAYLGLCWWAWQRRTFSPSPATNADWTVAYASQTGTAQALAQRSAIALERSGATVCCLPLNQLDAASLQAGGRFLFVVSTAGEGDAPDNAARFARQLLGETLDLAAVEFALLALGDRSYRHFCGFAERLAQWLLAQGARQRFARIAVDRGDSVALAAWRQRLAELGAAEEFIESADDFRPWRLIDRQHLNPGSAGGEVYQLSFAASGETPLWAAGDLAQIRHAADASCQRDYSIASLPEEGGQVRLLVRRHSRADGSSGMMSGWLTRDLPLGGEIALRLHRHPAFHLNNNRFRPLICIGNGVGLAGLRALLASRIATGCDDNWLLFGERNKRQDFHWQDELTAWQAAGFLARLDTAFSRDADDGHYVQDCLAAQGELLRQWVARGGAVYVCGSRQGMAAGIDRGLREIVGDEGVDRLQREGRYCRDVF
ncbi:MAG: hypothetical protein H6R15_2424 [Proteobacteria bacterium]|nr:hypothetical protein [Pseudomonadota bacterium]